MFKAKIYEYSFKFENLLKKILIIFFSRFLDKKESISAMFKPYDRKNFKKVSEKSFNFFGYEATKITIIIGICLLTVISFTIKYYFSFDLRYIKVILSNNFLTVSFLFLLIWALDEIIPNLIFYLINGIILIRARVFNDVSKNNG